ALEEQGLPFVDRGFGLTALQRRLAHARTTLEEQLARVAPSGVSLGTIKLEHLPAHEAIVRRAKELSADLIIVGPHRGLLRGSYLLGTTAQRVVQEASVPCLVTRGPMPWPWESVLLPVGAADVERGLLRTALRWIADFRREAMGNPIRDRCDVRILHVVRSANDWRDFSPVLARGIREAAEIPEVEARLRLRRAVAWSRAVGDEIVRIAEGSRVDVVAMGVCERGPLLHAALGSVSSSVLRRSSVPVVLFPPRLSAKLEYQAKVIAFPGRLAAR